MKKTIKTLILAVLATALSVMSFAGCVKNKNSDIINIGIIQMDENGAFKEMREAFKTKLTQAGYDESKVKVSMENAASNATSLQTAIAKVANNCDIIVPMTTTPAVQTFSYMKNQGINKPVIFMSVTDPIASGLMTTLKNPDKNFTGTSNVIPTSTIFDFADSFKIVKKYGIIYNSGNSAAVNTANAAKAYLDGKSVPYEVSNASTVPDAEIAIATLINKGVDAIYVPLDTDMQTAMTNIVDKTNAAKIPVYGSADVMVKDGALATIGVSYAKIGELTAEMVIKYIKGKNISEIPAEALNDFSMAVNLSTAAILEITIPADVLSNVNLIKYGAAV